jgi:deazaflavin-dependent oxidoreductase (nitroreductase family)
LPNPEPEPTQSGPSKQDEVIAMLRNRDDTLSPWNVTEVSNGTEVSMTWARLKSVADKQILYLTTIGRTTGLPREIEIWFVVWCERLYLFAETGEATGWVKNIRRNPKVTVRIGEWHTDATARVLDRHIDCKLWNQVAQIADRKYGWGEGLPVEITPLFTRYPFQPQGRA